MCLMLVGAEQSFSLFDVHAYIISAFSLYVNGEICRRSIFLDENDSFFEFY